MGRERIQSVQALRFIAAAMVVFNHAVEQAASLAQPGAPEFPGIGAAGVDIFFVLSGFVITLTGPLAEPRPFGRIFFWRRWSRVAPLFYLSSIPAVLLLGEGLDAPRTVATLFFWPALGEHMVKPYIGLGWTLCFEMVFYSAVSLFLLSGQLRRNALVGTLILAVLWAFRGRIAWNGMAMLANPIYLEFAAGVGLAILWPTLKRAPLPMGSVMLGMGVALFAALAARGVGQTLDTEATLGDTIGFTRAVPFGLAATMTVAGALILERAIGGAAWCRRLADLGDASYSIYLAHCLTMLVLYSLWRSYPVPVSVVVGVGTVVGIYAGIIMRLLVEKPLTAFVRRWPRLIQNPARGVRTAESPG
jgi:exopolysaccharide production protein ExoZ